MSVRWSSIGAAALIAILAADPAYAYVDPGTGSMLAQLVLGGVMAGLVLFRTGWRRVTTWFRSDSRSRDDD